jgi:hypothetical protein
MAKESRKSIIIMSGIVLFMTGLIFVDAISRIEKNGVDFTRCTVRGCGTTLGLAFISGFLALLSILALLGVWLTRKK